MTQILAVIALATSFIAWFVENHEAMVVYPFDATELLPAEAGEPRLREAHFTTRDRETLVIWVAPAAPGRSTILYFPGNAGTLADRVPRFSGFLDRGFGVVAMAYRGSSGSSGTPDEARLSADAALVANSLETLLGGPPPGPLVLYGESLGSALSVKLAAGGIGDALVLEAPFTSIPDLVSAQYPREDLGALFTQIWDTRGAIGAVRQPLLVLHGTDDRLVPLAQGEEIFARASSADKTLIRLDGVGHSGTWTAEARAALFGFLGRL